MKPGEVSSTLRALRYWEQKQEVMAHNLANASTHGFKAERVFARLLEKAGPTAGAATDFGAGELVATERSLDVALEGEGFLVVRTPRGDRLTRSGSLRIDETGLLVDAGGHPVLGDQGEILLPDGGEIRIGHDGVVAMDGEPVATLRVVGVRDTASLTREEGLYFATGEKLVTVEGTRVRQGFLEGSNVSPVESLVEMIEVQRAYASIQQAAKAMDGVAETLSNDLSRI